MEITLNSEAKLILIQPEHKEAIFKAVDGNRTHLRQWMGWVDGTKSVSDTEGFCSMVKSEFEQQNCHTFGIWVDGEFAGVASQNLMDKVNKATELGYWIAEKFQGRGLTRASMKELLRISFEEQKLNRVAIRAAVENKRSRTIPESLGFKFEGILRKREWLYDHYVDHAVYSILNEEWVKD